MSELFKRITTSSIKRQLMLGIALTHAVMMTFFVLDLSEKEDHFLQEQIKKSLSSLSHTLAINSRQALLSNDLMALEELLEAYRQHHNLRYAILTDKQGKVLAHTDLSKVGWFLSDAVSLDMLKSNKAEMIVDDLHSMEYATPIHIHETLIGWARISFNKEDLIQSRKQVYREGIIYTVITILIGLFVAFFMSRGLTNSLNALTSIIHSTTEGKRNIRVISKREDEVGILAQEFNTMLDRLEKNEDALKKSQRALQKLNADLELKVLEKTHALLQLNEHLEEKVEDEMEKNRVQIQQMIAQERHAQMGEMLSMIAHQWRQPLAAISAITGTIKIKAELSTEKDNTSLITMMGAKADAIEELTQVLTHTIDSFRNFYKQTKESSYCLVTEPIDHAMTIVEANLKTLDIKIIKDFQSTKSIELYLNELMQVIISIIKNSMDNFVKEHTAHPKLFLKTLDTVDGVRIIISDNGGGIPPAILERIFDPYFTTKGKINGTGLGLYMSKTIIREHHKGRLLAQNIEDGIAFIIELKEHIGSLKSQDNKGTKTKPS